MSTIKHKGQRVGVFIDTQNLYHSAKNLYHARVHFGNVLADAVGDRALIRARAYVITTESGDEQQFFGALEKFGIEIKTKDLQIFSSGSKKADWDVGLAVDAIAASPKLDTVILVTGDGDFVPLVEYLQSNQGCQVEVVSFGKSASAKLIEVSDDFYDLSQNAERYLLRSPFQKQAYQQSLTQHQILVQSNQDRKKMGGLGNFIQNTIESVARAVGEGIGTDDTEQKRQDKKDNPRNHRVRKQTTRNNSSKRKNRVEVREKQEVDDVSKQTERFPNRGQIEKSER